MAHAAWEAKVILATDLVGEVETGLRLAVRLARERSATLVVLTVDPLRLSDGEALLFTSLDDRRARLSEVAVLLATHALGVPYVLRVEEGDPEEEIASVVAQEHASLLVVEARPRLPLCAFGRTLVERLTARVSCPVVAYRPGLEEAPLAPTPLVHTTRRDAMEALTRVLDARVEALKGLLVSCRDAAARIAAQRSVRDGVATRLLARGPTPGGLLELELQEHARALGALGIEVLDPAGQVLLRTGIGAEDDLPHADFLARVRCSGPQVSLLLEPSPDAVGVAHVIQAGAPLDQALVLVTWDARRDFLRILAQPGPGPSAETYAFDRTGLMLSNSRFPHELRKVGLLPPDPGTQSARRVELRDPGGDLVHGEVALLPDRPLTKMAADATLGHDGADSRGYRDYRGVDVIGVWRWVPEFQFGVASEMDLRSIRGPSRRDRGV